MSSDRPAGELMISLNYLFPDVLASEDPDAVGTGIAESLQRVIAEELARLGVRYDREATWFFHLGTPMVANSTKCARCGSWAIPQEHAHATSVVARGWKDDRGRILCDQCCCFDDEGNEIAFTS